jgi:hypothetical protein
MYLSKVAEKIITPSAASETVLLWLKEYSWALLEIGQ